MHWINILARSLVVVFGVGIAFGVSPFDQAPSPFHEVFGSVVVLFGIYRLIHYLQVRRRASNQS